MAANLRQVAALAGVSAATVSRVFSNPEAVRERTRQRVTDAARELGWSPNQTARSLALGRTGNIGLMIPDASNPVFGVAIKDVQQFARERGFALFVVVGDGATEDERALAHAAARKVDGLILVAPRMSPVQLSELRSISPLALVNRESEGSPSTSIPSEDGMQALVEHLAEMGHHRIVYLAGPKFSPSNAHRLHAFQKTANSQGIEALTLGPFEFDYMAAGRAAADDVLASGATAAIGYNDLVAVGLITELHRRGTQPGRDIAVAGFDGSWLGETTSPALTSVELPFAEAIRWAVLDLIELLEGTRTATARKLPSRLIIRASTSQPFQQGSPPQPQPTQQPLLTTP